MSAKSLLLFSGEKNPNYIELDTVAQFLKFQKIRITGKEGLKISHIPKINENTVIVIDIENWFERNIPPITQISKFINNIKSRSDTNKIILLARKLSARKICDLYRYGLDSCFLSPIDYKKVNVFLRNLSGGREHIAEHKPGEEVKDMLPGSTLLQACQAVESKMSLSDLLYEILDLTLHGLNAEQGSILLYDEKSDRLKMLAARGLPDDVLKQGYIPRKGSIAEWVLDKNQPLILNDEVRNDMRFTSISTNRIIRSSMCVPLRVKEEPIGVINIMRSKSAVKFGNDDLQMFLILASQAAVAVDNARLYEENIKSTRLAAIGRTLSDISHCMKNILTGIRGGMALCDMSFENADVDMHDRGWDILKRNVDRISSLIFDMLDYSKTRTPARESAEPKTLINEVVNNYRGVIESNKISAKSYVPENIENINIDYNQIFRSLLNIYSNAIDAVKETTGGEVEISAKEIEPEYLQKNFGESLEFEKFLLITIKDNGVGIPPENLSTIFEPFFSTKGSKGTGLGLPVSKKIIEEHDGRIFVKSEINAGTEFNIVLPYEEIKLLSPENE